MWVYLGANEAGQQQHIFLPMWRILKVSPAADLKANAPGPIFGADFPAQLSPHLPEKGRNAEKPN